MNIDYFMQFVCDCREQIEQVLKRNRAKDGKTTVDCDLLVEMTKQVGALDVGRFYRERTLTGHYAERLLDDYMFARHPNKVVLRNEIIRKLLFEMPSHHFAMDFHICRAIKLPVEEMSEQESDMTKETISTLDDLTRAELICRDVDKDYKVPFFRLYKEDGVDNGASGKKQD